MTRRPGASTRCARPRSSLPAAAARLSGHAESTGERGLLVFAIDTELLGHWWREGPRWLRGVVEGAAGAGLRMVTVPEALKSHEPRERPLHASSWGEEKNLRTWDSPLVADIAWATRRSGAGSGSAQWVARRLSQSDSASSRDKSN